MMMVMQYVLCVDCLCLCRAACSLVLQMTAMAGGVGRRRFMVELEIKDLLAKKYKNLNGLEADLARLRKEAYQ